MLDRIESNPGKVFKWSLAFAGLVMLLLAIFTNGDGGGGDSIYHYLFARYAWKHPEFFLHHWAKPVFTALASPFALFGFTGIKVFNVLVSVATCWFTYGTAKAIKLKGAWLVALFFYSATLTVYVTLSGLTEPLFGLVLILAIYFYVTNRFQAGTLVVSFLPFVRSEGLVILGMVALYLIVKKRYRIVPLLAAGHLVLAVAGWKYYGDLLWVFRKIPYLKQEGNNYGSGSWDHFVVQLYFMIGPLLYTLLVAGLVGFAVTLVKSRGKDAYAAEKALLVHGMFLAFFMAHTAFWALGIFNSLGLTRVFAGVMPLVVLICAQSLYDIAALLPSAQTQRVFVLVVLSLVVVFPFLGTPASHQFRRDFSYTPASALIRSEINPYIDKNFAGARIYSSRVEIPFLLERDVFDTAVYRELKDIRPGFKIREGELLIWDNWTSVLEENVSKEELFNSPNLHYDTVFTKVAGRDTTTFLLFVGR